MYVRIKNPDPEQTQDARIDLPCSEEELETACRTLGINMMTTWPNVRVADVRDEGMRYVLPENPVMNIDELHYLAKRMNSFSESETKIFYGAAFAKGQPHTLQDMINLTFDLPGYSMLTDFKDLDYGGRNLYLQQNVGVPLDEYEQVDGRAFAVAEMQNNKTATVTPFGVLFDNSSHDQLLYDGTTFPDYSYRQSECKVTLTTDKGVTGYLSLPTTDTYIKKTLNRMGGASLDECAAQLEADKLSERVMQYANPEGFTLSESLPLMNELCKATQNMYEMERTQFSELIECICPSSLAELTTLAKNESDFELIAGVHDASSYGRDIAEYKIGGAVIKELAPYIDFKAYGEDLMKDDVGIMTPTGYLRYHGDEEDTLDILERHLGIRLQPQKITTIKLYMPLSASTYDEEYGEEVELPKYELVHHRFEIESAVEAYCSDLTDGRGLMTYYRESDSVNAKVKCAMPGVELVGRELMGVVTMTVQGQLTQDEMETFKDYWSGQMSDGWGEGFEQQEIITDDVFMGVSFWQGDHSWTMKTAEELGINSQPTPTMQMGGM